jgi:hypothetical protein
MKITVERKWFTTHSTVGEMSVDGKFFCYTLEPRADQSKGKPYCIPAGEYAVSLAHSARFNRTMPHVTNVPGFTEIMIHPGNFPRDTEGCCLVGATRGPDTVGNSVPTFEKLLAQLRSGASSIVYVDAANASGGGQP